MGVKPQQVHAKKVIRTPLTPEADWQDTGKSINYGGEPRVVYRRLKPLVARSELVPLRDENGKVIQKRDNRGDPMSSHRTERIVYGEDDPRAWETFILDDSGNGNVATIPWDMEAYERRQQEKKARVERQKKLDRLMDALSRSNVDPETLVADLEKRAAEEASQPVEEELNGVHKRGRWYTAYLNGEKIGSKETEEEAQALFLERINAGG